MATRIKRFGVLCAALFAIVAQPALAATRIIEYGGPGISGASFPVIPADQFVTAQAAMTATGTSAQSAAFNAATSLVCVQSDEAIYIKFGSNPTATTDNYRIQAAGEQCFSVYSGWKVAIRT